MKHVQVGPVRYRILSNVIADTVLEARDAVGTTDFLTQVITIRTGLPGATCADTILHEALHAMIYGAGIRFWLGDKREERLVTQLVPWLIMLLRDNPKLVKQIVEAE